MKNHYIFLILLFSLLTFGYAQQAGSLDTSFGAGGTVTTSIDNGSDGDYGGDEIYAVSLQSDGKIIVAGGAGTSSWYLQRIVARYNTDGSLDTSFGSGGSVLHGDEGTGNVFLASVVQPDDKIVAVGRYKDKFTVSRYLIDGSLDSDFGVGGIVNTDVVEHNEDNAFAVTLQSDGKIIVGGNTYDNSQVPHSMNFALVRYNYDGSLDTSFGTNGKVVTDFYGQQDGIHALAVQPDGRILAAGFNFQGNERRNFAIARYTYNGSLDTSFGTGGKVATDLISDGWDTPQSGEEEIHSIFVLNDGKILVGGSTNSGGQQLALAKYHVDGSLDSSFGNNGIVKTEALTKTAIALQDDGKIVATGFTSKPGLGNGFGVARFNSDGSLDTGFGDNGETGTSIGDREDHIYTLAIQPDGKIIVAGGATNMGKRGAVTSFALARYHGGESLGIDDVTDTTWLRVFPNPSTGRFSVETDRLVSNVSITNMLGQEVEYIPFSSEKKNFTIDLSQERKGLYFLTLKGVKGTETKKIVVH